MAPRSKPEVIAEPDTTAPVLPAEDTPVTTGAYAYKFTGEGVETFPSIVVFGVDEHERAAHLDGEAHHHALVCEPGDAVTLEQPVDHPHLEPRNAAAKQAAAEAEASRTSTAATDDPDAGDGKTGATDD